MTAIFEYINVQTFFVAIAAFFILNNLINYLVARINLRKANENIARLDREYLELTNKLNKTDKELNSIMSSKEGEQ